MKHTTSSQGSKGSQEELPEHLGEVLNTLKELQRRLDYDMRDGLAGSRGAGINPNHVKMAMQLANGSTQLSREVRAWLRKGKELAAASTLEERLASVGKFIQGLPPGAKTRLQEILASASG